MKEKWLQLIKENEEKIIELGIKAYEEALNNKHLRFIIEMDDSGDVDYWYDVAGGNSFHVSVHNGTAIELFQICFQYYDLEITEDDIISKLKEKGYDDNIEELIKESEEECTSIEIVILDNHEEFLDIIEECRAEAIAFDVSEYAKETIEQKLENTKKLYY